MVVKSAICIAYIKWLCATEAGLAGLQFDDDLELGDV